MDATVTIVNYNTVDKLRDCLRSIAETTHGMAIETIVVDNGSKDGSVDMVRREFPEVRLVPIRRRPAREAEAYRAVIVEALRYQPPVA